MFFTNWFRSNSSSSRGQNSSTGGGGESDCDRAAAEVARITLEAETKAEEMLTKFDCSHCKVREESAAAKKREADEQEKTRKLPPIKAMLVVLGGFLIQLTLGSFYR